MSIDHPIHSTEYPTPAELYAVESDNARHLEEEVERGVAPEDLIDTGYEPLVRSMVEVVKVPVSETRITPWSPTRSEAEIGLRRIRELRSSTLPGSNLKRSA